MPSPLRKTIAVFRAARIVLHLSYGLAITVIYPWFSQSRKMRVLQCWSGELLAIFNVKISIDTLDTRAELNPGIIVTNHISWLDVFVLNAVMPTRFVAKAEVRSWPVIGCLCAKVQTLFIERGKPRDAARINQQIVNLLQNGESLALFPEGTTTDGSTVGAFHASLLQPAIDAGVPIYPLALRYQTPQGFASLTPVYIGDTSLLESLWQILRCHKLHVRLVSTPTLDTRCCDRRTLARQAHQQISLAVSTMQGNPDSAISLETEETFQSHYAMLLMPPLHRPEATAID